MRNGAKSTEVTADECAHVIVYDSRTTGLKRSLFVVALVEQGAYMLNPDEMYRGGALQEMPLLR